MASVWDELEEVKVDDWGKEPPKVKNTQKSLWDDLEEVKQEDTFEDEFDMDFKNPQKKSFKESHPFVSSLPEAGKQLGQGIVHSYPTFAKGLNDALALGADKVLNSGITNNPIYKAAKVMNPMLALSENISKASAPATSKFAKNNAEVWDSVAKKVERPQQYSGMAGLKSKETFIPTLAGEVGEQATNLLMALGGGAGAGTAAKAAQLGKLGTGAATFAGTSVPNLAQEGQYLDKIEQFRQVYGRMPNAEELAQIQNAALGEKAINTALESVADKMLFGKLFPEGTASKGLKNIAKSMGQQGLTEGLTEMAQEGTSIGAEKLLGLNQDGLQANLARAGESGLLGALTGSVIGGATTAASQPYDTQFKENQNIQNAIGAIKNVSAQVMSNGKELYNSATDNAEPTAFDAMRNLSKQGAYTNPTVEELAPQTAEKIKNNNKKAKKKKSKVEELAPNIAQQIQETKNTESQDTLSGKVENQYTDDAKVVYNGNKYEALSPEELREMEAEQNPEIKIDENNEDALKGHVKKASDDIVIDKDNQEVLSGHVEKKQEYKPKEYKVVNGKTVEVTPETKKIEKLAPKTMEKMQRVENTENLQANETVEQQSNTNEEITNATKTDKKLPSIKYKVTVGQDNLTSDGLYMEGSNFHTDGNAAYLNEFVNADISKVAKTTKATDTVEQQMNKFFESTSQYTNKLVDIGKGIKKNKETWRVFEAGKYDNGEPRYVVINDKYLLDKKDLELYSDDENLYKPMSIRKNGKQIGIVMPITTRNGFNTSDMVDIKPMKTTAKNETTKKVEKEDNTTDEAIENINKENGVKDPFEVAAEDNGRNFAENIKSFAQNAKTNKQVNDELVIGEISPAVLEEARNNGVDLSGYKHTIDSKAIRHIEKSHSEQSESRTDQVPITEEDLQQIPEVLNSPDNVTYYKNKHLDHINYEKQMPDGQIFYIEEVRNGNKTLTTKTMYKKVGASDVEKSTPEVTSETSANNNIITQKEENLNPKESAQVESKSEQVKPKENTSKKSSKKKESKKLDDAGEFLQGNRKQDTSLTWDDLKDMNDLIRAKNTTKARVYPKPSIEDLKSEGFTEFQAGVIQNVYNKINAKPAAGYDKVEHQKQYVDTINEVMSSIKDYIKSHSDEFTSDLIAEADRKYRSWSYDYNKSLFDVVFPDTENKKTGSYSNIFRLYPEYNRKAIIVGGNKFTGALQLDRKTLVDVMKTIEDSKKAKETGGKVKKEPWEKNFVVLEPDRWNKEYAVANKNSKQVYARYATKEEAIAAAKRVQEKIDAYKDTKANFVRDYVERRENNKDVTTEELREAFGFRGVNFGNWTNEKERQNFVNYAYDSLYDLAELLNLPPKALSLNGQLGLAYGAQGKGGKNAGAAHYIPEYKDINLTKEYGAGSLAHEWWHALDNYFGNQATNKEYSREWALSLTKGGDLRPEVFEALENLQTQIKKAPFTEEDIKKRAEQLTKQTEARIKRYADSLKQNYAKAQNATELHKIIDDLVENKEKYKTYSWEDLHEITNKFFKLLPSNRDTLTNRGEFGWFTREITRLNEIEELARKGANKSEYLQNAEKIDKQSGGKYWSEDTELGARAFAAYMFDKMASQNIVNRFLTRSGGGAVLNFDAFKELAEGEEKEPLTISTTPKGEERKRIFDAFDKLFKTIKTRETDKGVELYSRYGDNAKEVQRFIDEMYAPDLPEDQDYIFYQRGVKPHAKSRIELINLGELSKHPAYKYLGRSIMGVEDVPIYLASEGDIAESGRGAAYYDPINDYIIATPDLPPWMLEHEIKHAQDQRFLSKTKEGTRELDKAIEANRAYSLAEKEYKNNPTLLNKIKIIYRNILYKNCKVEKRAYNVQKEGYKNYGQRRNNKNSGQARSGIGKTNFATIQRQRGSKRDVQGLGETFRSNIRGERKVSGGSTKTTRSGNVGQNSQSIQEKVRDKVYEWHGNLESDRYDVDKALNSFINLTKHRAKEISNKTGLKVSDKQLREIMPFLRERTGFPETLERDDLRTLFNKLSKTDKAELTKLADTVSDKFEKYYTNYKDAKGEQTSESIENHISHIWDLNDKKKSLLTNYITTNSKFAKQRTIGTFVEGIDGIEINGEKVQFKPKTLDYAEILKSSSDNLIKATHDSILANEIKNLKINGGKLVQPASKAPSDWVEINHPALNKAVYMGAVGEKELPMMMKTPVKVHPEIADYISSIFEVQKTNKFWNAFDSLNGIVKQALLGFSGFHGYALSESSIGNAGVGKTLKELNPKKFVDAIKNGNYDVYKNEEAAKRAINAGVQLGTPSDLQRNLVEETLKKVPYIGKYIAGGVSANNKILWDVLHNNFKVLAFNTAVENLGGDVTKEQERAIAQWVNDSFGGQAWELLGIKKSAIKAASRVLLSPDWNFSTIRQAAAAINSDWVNSKLNQSQIGKRIGKITGIGEEMDSKSARGKISRAFWLRSAIFFTVFYNLINAAFRERDRKEHPELYPSKMSPMDYSIWANSYPMDNIYDRIMPKVFIGRNSDGTSRMLRVGKQFREVPEFMTEPISKLGGKTSPLISIASQVGLGMSAGDVVKRATGKEAYLNQDIWEGYGEKAKMREGMDLAKGRLKALGKSLTPFIASKYIGGKHEFSAWDFFAQTNAGGSKSRVYKQTMAALQSGKEDKIADIKRHAYQDGLEKAQINKMVGYAKKNYQVENTKKYKNQFVNAIESKDKSELNRIKRDMEKHNISAEEQRRIYKKAWESYRKNNKS